MDNKLDLEQDRAFTQFMIYKDAIKLAGEKLDKGLPLEPRDKTMLSIAVNLVCLEFNRKQLHQIREEIEINKFFPKTGE